MKGTDSDDALAKIAALEATVRRLRSAVAGEWAEAVARREDVRAEKLAAVLAVPS